MTGLPRRIKYQGHTRGTAMRIFQYFVHIQSVILLLVRRLSKWTGHASIDVYFITPLESSDLGNCFCILLTAAYGQINSIKKWQMQFDQMLLDISFEKSLLLPLLFYIIKKSRVIFVLSKIVDGILLSDTPILTGPLTDQINSRLTSGTVTTESGVMLVFGLNIT